jgi:hypothetical protein
MEGKILRKMPGIEVAIVELPPTREADKDHQAAGPGTNDRGCLPKMRCGTHGIRATGKHE